MTAIESRAVGLEGVRSASRAAVVAGGACWAVGVVQYAVVQIVAAAAWTTPYSLKNNYISDLGNTACGMFHVPHGTPYYVCSPDHGAMNASFVIFGVLTIAGALLLRRIWPAGHLTRWAMALWVLSGLGKITVGLVPENTHIYLHLLGALDVPLASVAILLLSRAIRHNSRAIGVIGTVIGVVGLIGSGLTTGAEFGGSSASLGLGVGGAERLGSYPSSLWMLMIGLIAVFGVRIWQRFRSSDWAA
jgi:hypothetical membrane protein